MLKLKILLLGGIVSLVSFVGFSNAGQFDTMDWTDADCTFSSNVCYTPYETIYGFSCGSSQYVSSVNIYYDQYQRRAYSCPGQYSFPDGMNVTRIISQTDINDRWPSMSFYVSSSFINKLSPVVSGLSSAVSEIIPYIVYIGLGLLSAIIGFVAIKWLINWVRAKSFVVFSSRNKR